MSAGQWQKWGFGPVNLYEKDGGAKKDAENKTYINVLLLPTNYNTLLPRKVKQY
jgi:hypothetical protein